jgi:hypothetical protein
MFKRDCDLSVTENTALGKALDCVGEDHNLVEQGTITVSLCIDIVSISITDSEADCWKIGKTQRCNRPQMTLTVPQARPFSIVISGLDPGIPADSVARGDPRVEPGDDVVEKPGMTWGKDPTSVSRVAGLVIDQSGMQNRSDYTLMIVSISTSV